MHLESTEILGQTIYYRPGINRDGSDLTSFKEVCLEGGYTTPGFDVEPGETWLDLGANVGAFAVYCKYRNAKVICYEPDIDCFSLLQKNAPDATHYNIAVTTSKQKYLDFYGSKKSDNHWRGTIFRVAEYDQLEKVKNLYAGDLIENYPKVDGIKMDIEGSEGSILDHWMLPKCKKLCLEYHTSRDNYVAHLARRLNTIKNLFENVVYPSSYDHAIRSGSAVYSPQFDETIFAWSPYD